MTPAQARQHARFMALGREAHAAAAAGRIEDFLFICGGDPYRLSAQRAAERLGVSPRTVQRWRAHLRRPQPAPEWDGSPSYEVRSEYLDWGAA